MHATSRRTILALTSSIALALSTVVAASPAAAEEGTAEEGTAAITATIVTYPVEQPARYRLVDGQSEPVYVVETGDTLHVAARMRNTGSVEYWTMRMNFIQEGADLFATPGLPTHVDGDFFGVTLSSAIGAAPEDPEPWNGPYNRRSMQVNRYIFPGESAKLSFPMTIDNIPEQGVYYPITFRADTVVSDPALFSSARTKRIWVISE